MKYYYYYLLNMNNTKEQYYIELDTQDQNISTVKVKNAIVKKAVKRLVDIIGITDSENIKKLEKSIKSNIFDTCTLSTGYNNIEITGNFNKTESKKVIFKTLLKDPKTQKIEYKEIEGDKVSSKVYPNLDLYLTEYAYGKGYNIIFKGLAIAYTRTKNIQDIEESLQNINISEVELINRINESLIQLGVKEEIKETEVIENNTLETIEIKDDTQITATTTNLKDTNIEVNRDSIKLSTKDINNNKCNNYIINQTESFCNTG